MIALLRRRLSRSAGADGGTAIIEFVFVAVIMFVPLVYLLVAVAAVQRAELAVTQAAREAGRAYATSPDAATAAARAEVAVRLALADQGLRGHETPRYVAAGAGCAGAGIVPSLEPGAEFTVCVERAVAVPAIPGFLQGHGITTTGAYLVHIDDYRAAG